MITREKLKFPYIIISLYMTKEIGCVLTCQLQYKGNCTVACPEMADISGHGMVLLALYCILSVIRKFPLCFFFLCIGLKCRLARLVPYVLHLDWFRHNNYNAKTTVCFIALFGVQTTQK